MFKRIIAVLIILFLVLFSFGCGDSTSSSMNTVPEATFLPNFNASVDDLQTGASGTGFYNDGFYEDIFGQNSGILSLFNFYLNFYTQFKNNAEYNSDESRWEASFENGDLIVYGEFSNGVFVITSPDLPGITINLYPNEGSITVNIDGTPDFLDPNIRAELYKDGDYYYGFVLSQYSTSSAYFTKFYYHDINPTDEMELYYGRYVPLDNRMEAAGTKGAAATEFDIDEYIFIRNRNLVTSENWFVNPEDISKWAYLYIDETGFDYVIYN